MTAAVTASRERSGTGTAAAVNPITRLGVALLVALALLVSLDPVTPAVALVLELVLLPVARVAPRRLLMGVGALVLAAPLAAVSTALYGRDAGAVVAQLGPATVTEGSLGLALAVGLRVLAAALPAVVLLLALDPTELADALIQRLHLPHRFVLGALAGLRTIDLVRADLDATALARRARGLGDAGRLATAASAGLSVLVLALRRGATLSVAMEARGFGGSARPSYVRGSPIGRPDAVLAVIAVAVVAIALGVSLALGTWRPVWAPGV